MHKRLVFVALLLVLVACFVQYASSNTLSVESEELLVSVPTATTAKATAKKNNSTIVAPPRRPRVKKGLEKYIDLPQFMKKQFKKKKHKIKEEIEQNVRDLRRWKKMQEWKQRLRFAKRQLKDHEETFYMQGIHNLDVQSRARLRVLYTDAAKRHKRLLKVLRRLHTLLRRVSRTKSPKRRENLLAQVRIVSTRLHKQKAALGKVKQEMKLILGAHINEHDVFPSKVQRKVDELINNATSAGAGPYIDFKPSNYSSPAVLAVNGTSNATLTLANGTQVNTTVPVAKTAGEQTVDHLLHSESVLKTAEQQKFAAGELLSKDRINQQIAAVQQQQQQKQKELADQHAAAYRRELIARQQEAEALRKLRQEQAQQAYALDQEHRMQARSVAKAKEVEYQMSLRKKKIEAKIADIQAQQDKASKRELSLEKKMETVAKKIQEQEKGVVARMNAKLADMKAKQDAEDKAREAQAKKLEASQRAAIAKLDKPLQAQATKQATELAKKEAVTQAAVRKASQDRIDQWQQRIKLHIAAAKAKAQVKLDRIKAREKALAKKREARLARLHDKLQAMNAMHARALAEVDRTQALLAQVKAKIETMKKEFRERMAQRRAAIKAQREVARLKVEQRKAFLRKQRNQRRRWWKRFRKERSDESLNKKKMFKKMRAALKTQVSQENHEKFKVRIQHLNDIQNEMIVKNQLRQAFDQKVANLKKREFDLKNAQPAMSAAEKESLKDKLQQAIELETKHMEQTSLTMWTAAQEKRSAAEKAEKEAAVAARERFRKLTAQEHSWKVNYTQTANDEFLRKADAFRAETARKQDNDLLHEMNTPLMEQQILNIQSKMKYMDEKTRLKEVEKQAALQRKVNRDEANNRAQVLKQANKALEKEAVLVKRHIATKEAKEKAKEQAQVKKFEAKSKKAAKEEKKVLELKRIQEARIQKLQAEQTTRQNQIIAKTVKAEHDVKEQIGKEHAKKSQKVAKFAKKHAQVKAKHKAQRIEVARLKREHHLRQVHIMEAAGKNAAKLEKEKKESHQEAMKKAGELTKKQDQVQSANDARAAQKRLVKQLKQVQKKRIEQSENLRRHLAAEAEVKKEIKQRWKLHNLKVKRRMVVARERAKSELKQRKRIAEQKRDQHLKEVKAVVERAKQSRLRRLKVDKAVQQHLKQARKEYQNEQALETAQRLSQQSTTILQDQEAQFKDLMKMKQNAHLETEYEKQHQAEARAAYLKRATESMKRAHEALQEIAKKDEAKARASLLQENKLKNDAHLQEIELRKKQEEIAAQARELQRKQELEKQKQHPVNVASLPKTDKWVPSKVGSSPEQFA